MLNDKIAKIRKFIEKEKFYVWMILFVILVNSFSIISNPKILKEKKPQQKEYLIQQKLLKENPKLRQQLLEKIANQKPHIVYLLGLLTVSFLLGLFFGIILLIKFLIGILQGVMLIPKTHENTPIQWEILDVVRVAIIFVFLGMSFSLFEAVLLGILGTKQHDQRLDMILHTLLGDILGFLFVIYFVTVKHRQRIADLGISFKRFFTNIWVGLAGYIAFLPLLCGLFVTVLGIARILKYEPPPEPIMELFFEEKRTGLLVVLTILVSFVGPAIEEVFFRGFMYNAIKKRLGIILAMCLSAALFSVLHTNMLGFLPIMALGMLLAYLYEKSGSLIPSITIHIFHNSILTMLIFISRTLMGL